MLETPTHSWHASHGARLVDFAGWDMPVQYTSIVEEHNAVRNAVGLFDIAHMGRFRFEGPGAEAFLDRMLTNDVTRLKTGQIRYSLVTNEKAGILDDVLVYKLSDHFMLVVNASNREKIWNWLEEHQSDSDHVQGEDQTLATTMVALQGPKAIGIADGLLPIDVAGMKYYTGEWTTWNDQPVLVSRTGYTGEDGVELTAPADSAIELWETLMSAGAESGIMAAGLGCRDTLRLEAAMPLYGHELSEDLDPLTAGLNFAVKLDAADFIGRESLSTIKEHPTGRVRIGIELDGRRIAREHTPIVIGDETVGEVTSGTFSPTLQKAIGMGYIAAEYSKVDTPLEVDIRGKRATGRVVALPFYKRSR